MGILQNIINFKNCIYFGKQRTLTLSFYNFFLLFILRDRAILNEFSSSLSTTQSHKLTLFYRFHIPKPPKYTIFKKLILIFDGRMIFLKRNGRISVFFQYIKQKPWCDHSFYMREKDHDATVRLK